jgi:hypothetical protein
MTFTKDPDAILDYAVDWSRWLAGDTIASSVWIVPTGLAKATESNTTTKAIVWLSGGVEGQTYTVTNRITTATGRTEDRSFTIRVEER